MRFKLPSNKLISGRRGEAGFTLAETLAALLFMAIVIPVAIDALRIASTAGEVAQRKAEAARVAERVLNESVVTANGDMPTQNGVIQEGGHDFQWTLHSALWPSDSMQLLTVDVTFPASGRKYSMRLSTLVNLQQ
ncbi:MAG TPA: type II secretion system protein [Verrucomicrobiae bacterium]|nr:type II secretion system protein [Verrucomicrobiae bacterium]